MTMDQETKNGFRICVDKFLESGHKWGRDKFWRLDIEGRICDILDCV
jgi:hypothetical protein